MVFGGGSYCIIYDKIAKVVKFIAQKRVGMPPSLVVRQVDEVVGCNPTDAE